MFWRYGVPLIIALVFALLLLGWGIAYWRSRRDVVEDKEFEQETMEHERQMMKDYKEMGDQQ
jgi:hypothetical protein